jgi:acyl-CoA synthetase (AMP-forming)/AMP-acid ligase II
MARGHIVQPRTWVSKMPTLPGVGSWIERRARTAPDHIALVHGPTRRSYVELAERVARLSSGLRALGVVHGDRVGWLGENHPAFLETLFATARLGAVFAPVNYRLPPAVVAGVLDDYAVKVIMVEDAAAAIELPAGVPAVHVRGRTSAASFEDLIANAPAAGSNSLVDSDDVCIMPHTSGTTGPPKGVMLTHANVTWNAINMCSVADLRVSDVTLALAPLFRTGGVGVNVLPVLFKGGTVVVPVSTAPDDVLDAIEREGITVGFGNPDLLDALALSPRWATVDLSSLRFIITGGAPVPARLISSYGDRDVTFLQGYGLSEASPVVSVLDAPNAARKSGSAGRAVPFVDVRTERRDGSECAPRETGELLVKGPNVMAGYWNRPDATRAAIDRWGWLHTGDAARIDEEGFVWIIDRLEHAFTIDGHLVYPGDVERCIGEHPGVRDVGVTGVDGFCRAFVVLHNGCAANAADIIEHCRARLDPQSVPASVLFVDALPRTSVGKLDRLALFAASKWT